jgi:hypothetical protein
MATADVRAKDHRRHRRAKELARYNSGLARWLQSTEWTLVKVLAEVDDSERFAMETEITRQLRQRYKLLNVLDGTRHTEESRKRYVRAWQERGHHDQPENVLRWWCDRPTRLLAPGAGYRSAPACSVTCRG